MNITDELVELCAKSIWQTERWHFMETFEADIDEVKEYFRGRARQALEATFNGG